MSINRILLTVCSQKPKPLLIPRDSYAALDADGQVDALASTQDLAQVHAVSEDEIRAATEELRRSTEAIRKQTEVLQLQSQALDRLKQKRTGNDASREELERSRHRKCETERKHLSGEVACTI